MDKQRPTTKKVNGHWYDINQAAERIVDLEAMLRRQELFYEKALQEAARDYIQDYWHPVSYSELKQRWKPAPTPEEAWAAAWEGEQNSKTMTELEAEIALLEKQNNAMRDNPNNAALAEHILAADVLMKRNSELEAKLERLREAITSAVGGMRAPYRTSSYVHILREDFDRLMEALEQDNES